MYTIIHDDKHWVVCSDRNKLISFRRKHLAVKAAHDAQDLLERARYEFQTPEKNSLDGNFSRRQDRAASQPITQRKLGLIEGLPAPIAYSKKAKPMASSLRPRTPWRTERRHTSRYELPPLHTILADRGDRAQSSTSR